MKFANFIGEINFKIIFTVFFFTLIGIYASIKKIFQRKMPDNGTFWIEKKYGEPDTETMQRQF